VKLNRIYYKHLWKSILLVAVGLGIVIKEEYPGGALSDNFFILIMVVLSAFFSFLGIITLFMRFEKGAKFRRKFAYCLFGVANLAIGILSLPFAIMHSASAGILSIIIYIVGFLIGVAILADIFFGKRSPKQEREMLIT
jgi:hypothetical protein